MKKIQWAKNNMPKTADKQLAVMSLENVGKARKFHESFPQYSVTPLAQLKGCQAHCSVILSPPDEMTYRKLGLQLTCEPRYQTNNLYHR